MDEFFLKLKTKNGQIVFKTSKHLNTIADLKFELSKATNIPPSNLYVLCGYPPKKLDLNAETNTLEAINVHSGDTLIIEERVVRIPDTKEQNAHSENNLKGHDQNNSESVQGILIKKVVPADNSCLFTSIGFVLGGRVDVTCGSYMRPIIAEEVINNHQHYNEAILGRPNLQYSKWILRPESWGGAIELAILSKFYHIEIVVVDTVNGILNRFGEDQHYDFRGFLLFDGVHYDPLYCATYENLGQVRTLFSVSDEAILRQAELLAVQAKSSRQFTDVNKFNLKCHDCNKHFVGQAEAVAHAKESGHKTFGEITS